MVPWHSLANMIPLEVVVETSLSGGSRTVPSVQFPASGTTALKSYLGCLA